MKTRKGKKGTFEEINVRQILLTKPIINQLKKNSINISDFSLQKGEQGFSLKRLNTFKNININSLIKKNPIVLKKTKYGKHINGTKKQLYEIIDGRHRITTAIVLGKKKIKANIQ